MTSKGHKDLAWKLLNEHVPSDKKKEKQKAWDAEKKFGEKLNSRLQLLTDGKTTKASDPRERGPKKRAKGKGDSVVWTDALKRKVRPQTRTAQ